MILRTSPFLSYSRDQGFTRQLGVGSKDVWRCRGNPEIPWFISMFPKLEVLFGYVPHVQTPKIIFCWFLIKYIYHNVMYIYIHRQIPILYAYIPMPHIIHRYTFSCQLFLQLKLVNTRVSCQLYLFKPGQWPVDKCCEHEVDSWLLRSHKKRENTTNTLVRQNVCSRGWLLFLVPWNCSWIGRCTQKY